MLPTPLKKAGETDSSATGYAREGFFLFLIWLPNIEPETDPELLPGEALSKKVSRESIRSDETDGGVDLFSCQFIILKPQIDQLTEPNLEDLGSQPDEDVFPPPLDTVCLSLNKNALETS